MSKTYLKVFFKKKANVANGLELIKTLKINPLVKEVKVYSSIFSEPSDPTLKYLTKIPLKLQQKYLETERFLAILRNRGANDQKA